MPHESYLTHMTLIDRDTFFVDPGTIFELFQFSHFYEES